MSHSDPKLDERIRDMLEKGITFCEHKDSVILRWHIPGSFLLRCGSCMITVSARTEIEAFEKMIEETSSRIKRYNELKEKTMYVPADPHEAYRFGVKQATEPIDGGFTPALWVDCVNSAFEKRRKELLTKKITKWFFLYKNGPEVSKSTATSDFYDSKEAAYNGSLNRDGAVASSVLAGPFSFEIEVPV